MNNFEKIYLDILNEEKSPTSFTPEEFLNDAKNKCFKSNGEYFLYTIDDMIKFSDSSNKDLFKIFINNLKYKNDYAIVIVYFNDFEQINEIFNFMGYIHPNYEHKLISMNKVKNQFIEYYKDLSKRANNFNSIDICPELGCIIGLNGKLIKTNRDFEKELDHELNHYFEGMNVHYKLEKYVDDVKDVNDKEIIKKLSEFYKIDFSNKTSFINDIRYHMFNDIEFRSMCANVFHEIIRYNENHFNDLKFEEFINDVINCNYHKYDDNLKDYILFSWICYKISYDRWEIVLLGIKDAINIHKNIFEKAFIKTKDWIRNLFLHI